MVYKYSLKKLVSEWEDSKKFLLAKVKSILVNLHLLKSGNYKEFAILGRSRTGSNFLKSLINSHPNAICYGEVFRAVGKEGEVMDTKKILLNRVFHKYAKEITAVGFKIFYYHANTPTTKGVWDYISENKVKIIHITRRNMLETIVSRKKSEITDAWTKRGEKEVKEITFSIGFEECKKEFEWTTNFENEYREKYANNPVLEIIYEELALNPQKISDQICNFLEIGKVNLETNMKKQNTKRLRNTVLNYDELKEKFSETEFSIFFTE